MKRKEHDFWATPERVKHHLAMQKIDHLNQVRPHLEHWQIKTSHYPKLYTEYWIHLSYAITVHI
jgi:hypothetical protein